MLKLVILTEEAVAEGAPEDPPPVVPHTPVTLQAMGICQGTSAGMGGQAFAAMTHPPFTEITYRTLHNKNTLDSGISD